jgi:DNA-binding Lrp family transcriptional regulator
LDRLDLDILKSLLLNNGVPPGNPVLRKSFRALAKELGVDQGTIRKRMRTLQEQHVLKGWYLGTTPGLTGHDVVYSWLRVEGEDSKDRVIEKLLGMKEVERVCNYLGPKISIVLFCKKGTDQDTAIERLGRQADLGVALHKQGLGRTPIFQPKGTELAVIESLRRDPWKPYSVVAKEVGVSSRTVKRIISRLSEEGVAYMLPIIDLKALQGIVPVELVVDYSSPELKTAVNERILPYVKEWVVFSDTGGPFGYFALAVPNVSQVEQIARWVRRQEGVADSHADVLQDVLLNRNHYEGLAMQTGPEVAEKRVKASPRH